MNNIIIISMSRGRRWEGKGEAEYLTIVITICCVGGGGWWTFVYYHKVLIPRRIVSNYFHHIICWVLIHTNRISRLFPPSDSNEMKIEESNLMRYNGEEFDIYDPENLSLWALLTCLYIMWQSSINDWLTTSPLKNSICPNHHLVFCPIILRW